MTPQDYFNIALILVAVSLAMLIAAIVYNSKSKETLREAKDISNKAKAAVEEMKGLRDKALEDYHRLDIALSKAQLDLSLKQGEVKHLKDNLHALGEEIVNPELPPTFRIEESEEIIRVMADYTTLNGEKTLPLIVREYEKADNLSLAWAKANKLLTALKK